MANGPVRPICFMVSPFGIKDTGLTGTAGPSKVNFDTLWAKAFSPALQDLGYTAVRADQDTGALIIQEMLERLALSDLVVADMSIPNGNVYYEIGMRHVAKKSGCVLISADWAKPLFDTAQFRRITYPLSDTEVSDEEAQRIRKQLTDSVELMKSALNPPYCLDGFPDDLRPEKTSAFRDFVVQLSEFQARVTAARLTTKTERREFVKKILEDYVPDEKMKHPILPGVAQELMYLVRDTLGWEQMVQFIERLPNTITELPKVQEQFSLGRAKLGQPREAIGTLIQLIERAGDSSERRGLLGGRHKQLFLQALDETERSQHLSAAIDEYTAGMLLDLNNYYPACNLPRLLKARNEGEDLYSAASIVRLVEITCTRAEKRDPKDLFVKPTLLGAAFDSEDPKKAAKLLKQIIRDAVPTWVLDTTLVDLEFSVGQVQNSELQNEFTAIIYSLKDYIAKFKT